MKKVLGVIAAAGCLAAASTALAGIAAGTGVNGSLHDMTKIPGAKADAMGRVCVYCHTPHHAEVKRTTAGLRDYLPLWNHEIPTESNYTPYTWATPNNAGTNDDTDKFVISDPLRGPSRLCMSCHDGSIAIDEHGMAFDQAGVVNLNNYQSRTRDGGQRARLTNDLSNTHPIGFNYNEIAQWRNTKALNGDRTPSNGALTGETEIVRSDKGYATAISISNSPGVYNWVTRAVNGKHIADNLFEGAIMTCATCHEVHNKENATQDQYADGQPRANGLGTGTETAPNYFLYAKQSQSLICLSCHIK